MTDHINKARDSARGSKEIFQRGASFTTESRRNPFSGLGSVSLCLRGWSTADSVSISEAFSHSQSRYRGDYKRKMEVCRLKERPWGGTSVLAESLQKAFVALVLALVLAASCRAQSLNSGGSTITLRAILRDSLSINLSANAVNFALTAGSNTNRGNTSVIATTTWLLRPGIRNVRVYAFFANSSSALTNGAGTNIPSADFQLSDNAGPFTALTTTTPFGGANAGLLLSTTRIRRRNRIGRRTDTMNFNINLTPLPNLPAGTYNGTLTIQAQAI